MLRGGVPLSSPRPRITDLLPSCQRILLALIWGSLLMLALAQQWFLWQLQRQMQGCFQLR